METLLSPGGLHQEPHRVLGVGPSARFGEVHLAEADSPVDVPCVKRFGFQGPVGPPVDRHVEAEQIPQA